MTARDFAMEAAEALWDDRETDPGSDFSAPKRRWANLIRPIIEAAQAAVRPEVAEGDREFVHAMFNNDLTMRLIKEGYGTDSPEYLAVLRRIAAYREAQCQPLHDEIKRLGRLLWDHKKQIEELEECGGGE